MTYSLQFHEKALKEWKKLDETTRSQLKKKLAERLQNPHIQADRLSGFSNPTYKIKLRSIGYRLVYEVMTILSLFLCFLSASEINCKPTSMLTTGRKKCIRQQISNF